MALANSSHRTDRSERRSRHSLLAEEEIIGHNNINKRPKIYGRPSGASPSSQSKRGAQIFSSKGAKVAGNSSPLLSALNSPFLSSRSEEHTSELQSHSDLVCRLLLEKK